MTDIYAKMESMLKVEKETADSLSEWIKNAEKKYYEDRKLFGKNGCDRGELDSAYDAIAPVNARIGLLTELLQHKPKEEEMIYFVFFEKKNETVGMKKFNAQDIFSASTMAQQELPKISDYKKVLQIGEKCLMGLSTVYTEY